VICDTNRHVAARNCSGFLSPTLLTGVQYRNEGKMVRWAGLLTKRSLFVSLILITRQDPDKLRAIVLAMHSDTLCHPHWSIYTGDQLSDLPGPFSVPLGDNFLLPSTSCQCQQPRRANRSCVVHISVSPSVLHTLIKEFVHQ
jgi:hypothetical protein